MAETANRTASAHTDVESLACPVCGSGALFRAPVDATTGMVTCHCGHSAFYGYVAEATYLSQRQRWLNDRIREGLPGPDPEVAREYGVWPVLTEARDTSAYGVATTSPRPRGTTAQNLLLILGAALLLVAAVVFAAVAWPRLGPAGQLAILLAATLGACMTAAWLQPRLPGTAEAVAALGFGLVLLDAVAAPDLEVVPASWNDLESGYWLAVLGSVAIVSVWAGHSRSLRSWVWLGWLTAGAATVPATAMGTEALGGGNAALAVGLTVATTVGLALGTLPWRVSPDPGARGAIGDALRADRGPLWLSGGLCLAASAVTTAVLVLGGEHSTAAAATATTATTAGVAALLIWLPGSHAPAAVRLTPVLLGGLSVGMGLALLPESLFQVSATLAGLVGALALLAGGRSPSTAIFAAATWTAWPAMVVSIGLPQIAADEASGMSGVEQDVVRSLGTFLAVVSLSLLISAWRDAGSPQLTWVAWPGAIAGYAAFAAYVTTDLPEYPTILEAWTLPAAAMLGIAGLLAGRGRQVSSLERVGPAAIVALIPSAIATWYAPWVQGFDVGQGHVPRLIAILLVSGGLAVVGAWKGWAGVLAPAAAALLITAAAQVWTGLDALPRWVAFGIVGSVLLVAGARFEWLRSEARRARAWGASLT